jgi:hypothetical protein
MKIYRKVPKFPEAENQGDSQRYSGIRNVYLSIAVAAAAGMKRHVQFRA